MHLKTRLTLPLLIALASPALADSDKALLDKCDGMTRAGTIDPKLKDGVIGGFPERRCAKEAELAQDKAEIAKLYETLVLLDPAQAKATLAQDISKTEQLLL